jgi:hypothetical protein
LARFGGKQASARIYPVDAVQTLILFIPSTITRRNGVPKIRLTRTIALSPVGTAVGTEQMGI